MEWLVLGDADDLRRIDDDRGMFFFDKNLLVETPQLQRATAQQHEALLFDEKVRDSNPLANQQSARDHAAGEHAEYLVSNLLLDPVENEVTLGRWRNDQSGGLTLNREERQALGFAHERDVGQLEELVRRIELIDELGLA